MKNVPETLRLTVTACRFARVLREARRRRLPLQAALGAELARPGRRVASPVLVSLDQP